jgi:copper homeostasis protein (lipoprotein)
MLKSFFLFVMLATTSFFFQSCGEAPKEPAATEAPAAEPAAPTADPAQAAVEQLAAFYTGNLPCPDCDGIQTLLTLNADPQRSYTLEEQYQGKQPKTVNSNGTWAVEGNTVTLNGKSGAMKYQVTAEGLVGMNTDGSTMDATKYLLKKVQGE